MRSVGLRLRLALGELFDATTGRAITGTQAPASVPTGVIVLWAGALGGIPAGWALCDGTHGTPDLRERFVKGTASGVTPGSLGGAVSHTHPDHPALAHAGMTVDDHASHTHDGASTLTQPKHFLPDLVVGQSPRTGGPDAVLTHTVTQATAHAAQAHTSANHEPAYYTVAFIMKL